jgi:hypothetical protein
MSICLYTNIELVGIEATADTPVIEGSGLRIMFREAKLVELAKTTVLARGISRSKG